MDHEGGIFVIAEFWFGRGFERSCAWGWSFVMHQVSGLVPLSLRLWLFSGMDIDLGDCGYHWQDRWRYTLDIRRSG